MCACFSYGVSLRRYITKAGDDTAFIGECNTSILLKEIQNFPCAGLLYKSFLISVRQNTF